MATCPVCSEEFAQVSGRVYCSTTCRNRSDYLRRNPMPTDRACEWCAKPLPQGARRSKRFCDYHCSNAAAVRKNRAERVAANRRWRLANPEAVAARGAARRARMASPFVVTSGDWAAICRQWGHQCAYCNAKTPLTRDHGIPLVRGGQHRIGNLLPACKSCNSAKGARTVAEFRYGKKRTH